MAYLTPEQLAAMTHMVEMNDEKQRLAQQMQMAQALRTKEQAPHTTGTGAAFGALGHITDSIFGGLGQSRTRDREEALSKQRADAWNQYLNILQNQGQ